MTRLLIHRLALAAIGLIAFVGVESPYVSTRTALYGMIGAAVVVAAAANFWMRRGTSEVADKEVVAERSLVTTKRILLAMMAIGIAAFVGGRATMATFSAETSNAGSTAASGTLTMNDTVGASSCDSYGAGSNADNTNYTCGAVLSLANVAPGAYAGAPVAVTLKNTGSIDARSLYVFAPYANTTLNCATSPCTTAGSSAAGAVLAVTAVDGTINLGDTITISYAQNSMTCTVGGTGPVAAEAGATSLTINTCTTNAGNWNYAYPKGARVQDTSSDTSATNTECYDSQTTSSTVSGATYGTQLTSFNEIPPLSTAHTAPTNGMCTQALIFVQEQSSSGKNYCWYGNGSGGSSGGCVAPISSTLSAGATISSSTTTLSVSALKGNVLGTTTHDVIKISEGNNSTTCNAQANAYIGDTSITVSGCSPTNTFTTAAVVTDTTTLTTLNNDTTHTIQNFDTSSNWGSGKIPLYTVSGNGTVNNPSAIELNKHGDSGDTRIFYIGAYLPATSGSGQNTLQGLQSTFGISWHIDQ